ncbi:MAG TPA: OmpA family protein [Spirochaetota bacterium]|nr:OmpA family protein [Spirochaetota bacterium]
MKKYISLLLAVVVSAAFALSCAQTTQQAKTEVKQETTPKVKSDAGDSDMAVSMINRQVKDFSIDGFRGGSAKLSKNEDLENMKKIVALVKPIIEKVPDGYVMQITGHAANYNSTAMQMSVSKARAAKIYDELKKAGVPASKMTYKGVGINEPLEGYSDKDPKQRRVSFKAVKK